MSVITRLRKARPYLTAPFNDEEENAPLSPDRMSGIPSTPIVNQPDQPPVQPRTPRPQLMQSQTADTPAVPDLTPTDFYQGNRNIRPKMDTTIRDPQARLTDYESNLINYEPQKEGAGKIIGRAALGFISGGIPGAAYTAGHDLLDRKALDRNWQQGQIQNTEGMIGRLNTERRAGLQDQLIESETAKNRAEANRTPAISQSRHKITVPDDRYKQFGINANDKVWADVNGAPVMQDNQPVLADRATSKPAKEPIFKERLNQDGTKSTLQSVDNGETWTEVPLLGSAAPPQPQVPDVAAQNAPDIKTINDRLQTNLKEQRQHEDEIAAKNAAIKKQGEADYQEGLRQYNAALANGEKPAKPQRKDFYECAQNNDPDYLDGTVEKVNNRVKELKESNKKDQSDLEGLQREARRASQKPRKVSSNGFKPDGKYHYTPDEIRQSLAPGQTYEEIYGK